MKDILIDVALIAFGAAVIVFGIISTFAGPILYLKLLFS